MKKNLVENATIELVNNGNKRDEENVFIKNQANIHMNTININMLNIQCLTQSKLIEIENNICNNDVYLLLETHEKRHQTKINPINQQLTKMRNINDKKGGGLMVIWRGGKNININEIITNNCDIMLLKLCVSNNCIYVLLIYMATNDNERNKYIMEEIEIIIRSYENKPLMIMGDFNGHLGYIGVQPLNKNGQNVIKLINSYDLILINTDPMCKGEITREQSNVKSVIDFVLVNSIMYPNLRKMTVDDDEIDRKMDISDHNLITVNLEMQKLKPNNYTQPGENIKFYKINDVTKKFFLDDVKSSFINNGDGMVIGDIQDIIIDSANKNLQVEIVRKENLNKKKEPIWFSYDIKKEISIKRDINKLNRKSKNIKEKQTLTKELDAQKMKIKRLVNKAVEKYEHQLANKILSDKNRRRHMWLHIRSLQGESKIAKKHIQLYNKNGEKIPETDIKQELEKSWKSICQMRENKIPEYWNSEEKIKYSNMLKDQPYRKDKYITGTGFTNGIFNYKFDEISYSLPLRDHIDSSIKVVSSSIQAMKKPYINKSDVITQIKQMKDGKAPGPDGVKAEVYKILLEDDDLIETISVSLNKCLETTNIPNNWKTSNTILIEKKNKPTVDDLRPIALTNVLYKIFMGILKKIIEKHIKTNDSVNEMQMGSTKDRRAVDNLFLLDYCINKTYESKSKLFAISIDYSKAFDSIDRVKMISVLKDFKVHENIIEIISKIYFGDETNLILNKNKYTSMKITNGIRQGCSCSALLFILVTYFIINTVVENEQGYKDQNIYLPCLFYMDDAILLTKDKHQASSMLASMEEVSDKCGLKLNRKKCKILIFNNKDKITKINDIDVVEELIYLGIIIKSQRKWYVMNNKKSIEKANKICNTLYSVLGNSCNKMLIGKTFWKVLAIPNFLYGQEIVIYNKMELGKFQEIENRAFRQILQVPSYTAVEFLRGEIGASDMITRDMKSKILYLKHALTNKNNELLKYVMDIEIEEKNSIWIKTLDNYLEILDLNYSDIINKNTNQIISIINRYDNKEWKEKMLSKSTLSIYNEYKLKIEEEKWYRNGFKYNVMMRTRSNSLKLNWRNWGFDQLKTCNLCSQEVETLEHFLLKCPKLQSYRNKYIELQKPYKENMRELMATIMLLNKNRDQSNEYYIDMIHNR